MDKMLMQGKVAMVTGGGRGIGEASARRLADFGAKVILADLDLASATAVAESLKAEGKEAAAIEFNVAGFPGTAFPVKKRTMISGITSSTVTCSSLMIWARRW